MLKNHLEMKSNDRFLDVVSHLNIFHKATLISLFLIVQIIGFIKGGTTEYNTVITVSISEGESEVGFKQATLPVLINKETRMRWGMQVEKALFCPCEVGILSTDLKI